MLFPAHVEALRVEMVERVWKESTVVGPLPELMCDIMAYIPKPALTLDCPMEEIIIKEKPDFFFANGGIVYGVFNTPDQVYVEQISPPGNCVDLVRNTYREVWYNATYYYDADAGRLYVLREGGGYAKHHHYIHEGVYLLEYDVKARRVVRKSTSANFQAMTIFPQRMAVIGGHVFLAVEWYNSNGEVLYADPEGRVNVIWHAVDGDFEFDGLHPVSASPLTLDVIYSKGGACHSVRLEMTRPAAPIMFKETCASCIPELGAFGGGILIAGFSTRCSFYDSRLRKLSSASCMPRDPEFRSIQTDRYGNIYLLIERYINNKRSFRVLFASPYI
ncbi:hypothetical protein FOZ63_026350 [Perkinsus olseni]|uniref:Uncharacterized protein n=1 Tax=Perkinsus olseni TaxID=32597 RepID=A0A7J6QP32_PEROL|nr:hypothetical protein FOZ62_006878 [Perkinsus olseni]KAF4709270.1 hypothetical protein FOZ63_026350 [Perkinsus olseni]